MKIVSCVVAGLVFGFAGNAMAQMQLQELLNQGAVKLDKAALEKELPLRWKGHTGGAGVADLLIEPGGKLSGEYILDNPRNAKSPIVGSWTIDANGLICFDETFPAFSSTYRECRLYMYGLNGKIYGSRVTKDRLPPDPKAVSVEWQRRR